MQITKTFIANAITAKLNSFDGGNVSTQFDGVTLQAALDNLNDTTFAAAKKWFAQTRDIDIMDWATFIADPITA